MPSRIILCPGQGAQAIGMAKKWFDASPLAREVFAAADRVLGSRLGAPLSELCFNGPADRLNQTDAAQPAIYTASVACWRATLSAWGAGPNTNGSAEAGVFATAGLSLGEYTALHIAGCFSFEDGLELVTLRGRAMQDAATAVPSGMVALIGATEEQAESVCDAARSAGGHDGILVCANFNAPGQVVLSGDKAACERALGAAVDAGLRAQALPVAGAFHSPIMAPAADRLAQALARTPIAAPRCRVYSNVTAAPHHSDGAGGSHGEGQIDQSIRARLIEQLTSPVRWAQSCTRLVADAPTGGGGSSWHELSPGKTLAGLMRRIDKNVKVESHDEPAAP